VAEFAATIPPGYKIFGLNEKYVLKKVAVAGSETAWKDEVEENGFDHVQDALQGVAVEYDRPRLDKARGNRMAGEEGSAIDFADDYPSV
jgi:hypothetical protein